MSKARTHARVKRKLPQGSNNVPAVDANGNFIPVADWKAHEGINDDAKFEEYKQWVMQHLAGVRKRNRRAALSSNSRSDAVEGSGDEHDQVGQHKEKQVDVVQ